MKKVIVVGGTSGIGLEIAKEHLSIGNQVAVTGRREDELKKIETEYKNSIIQKQDVKDFKSSKKIFLDLVAKLGGLDEIYYCSGIIYKISIDEFDTEKDLEMIQVNYSGAVALLNEAAIYFQTKKSGKIIGISSIAGDRGRVGNPVYNSSKAALSTYLESLKNRLSKKNITVLTVKPGFVDTDMTKGLKGLFWLISANKAAKIIIKAAEKNKEDIYVPFRWWFVAAIIKLIPNFIFKKLNV